MISFWTRELAGWVLVVIGLGMFGECYRLLMLNPPQIIQVGPLTLMAIFVFRGGIHLLKVAVAARICQQAAREGMVNSPSSQSAVAKPAP